MKTMKMIAGGFATLMLAISASAQTNIIVDPTGAVATSAQRAAINSVNGYGLNNATIVETGDAIPAVYPSHDTSAGSTWCTNPSDGDPSGVASITYTLGGAYNLTGFHLWNYNEVWTGDSYVEAQRGISDATMEYSSDNGTNWTLYGDMSFTQASSSSSYTGEDYSFSNTLAGVTDVRYTVLETFDTNSTRAGFSEIRFIADPPPVPLAPTVRKIWMNGTTAKLYWNEAAGATSYWVEQSNTSGTNYVPVAFTNALEYWVTNLTEGATYYFAIAGINGNGLGDLSPELSGTVTNFSIISDGGGTYQNSIYTLPEAVFDGDTATTYDGNNAGAWVGIDLGAGHMRSCPAVDFYPRSGNAARMSGAQFQGSNDGSSWDTLATVSGTPAYDWSRLYTGSTNVYRYFRCYGAQFGNVAEIKFLSVDDVPDVLYSTFPSDGTLRVPVDVSNIVVTATDISTQLSSVLYYGEMLVNSNSVDSYFDYLSSDTTTFTYEPASNLEYEKEYTVQLYVYRFDGVTNIVNFSFTTGLNTDDYLIAPGVRNGGFELVDGTNTYTGDMNDWSRIDGWEYVPSQQSAKTRYGSGATERNRYLDTARNSINYNLTDHVVQQGDILDFQFTMSPDRQAGAIVGLCYSNAVSGVTNIAASEVTVPDLWGGGYERVENGTYVVGAGDPAIGHRIGLMIKDNGNNPTNDTSITEAHVDDVRLRLGDLAIQSVSPADGATGVANPPAIQVVVAEGLDQVDTGTIVLSVDGGSVTPDSVADSSNTVTIIYTPASPLSVANHTVSVHASGMNGETVGKTWSFEVAAGGAPSNPTIGSFTVGVGTVGLSWDSEPGVDYYIVSTTNLVVGPWTTNQIITGDGSTISTNIEGGAEAAEFYKLEAQ